MKSIFDYSRPYQFLFDFDAQIFRYCAKKSGNLSNAPTTPTRDIEKYSQIKCILICIECNILDGR